MNAYGPGTTPEQAMRQMDRNGYPPQRPDHMAANTLEERRLDDWFPPGFVVRVQTYRGMEEHVVPNDPANPWTAKRRKEAS